MLDDLDPFELEEVEPPELVLPDDEDELVDPDEEETEDELDPPREKLNPATLLLPEVRSNSGT